MRRDSRIASGTARRSPRTRRQVGGLDRDVGAGAHGQAQVGLGQRGGVVDPVADHRHHAALGLQPPDRADLVVRQHLGDHLADAHRLGHGPARRASLSPVSSTGDRPEAAQPPRPPRAEVGLTVSDDHERAADGAVPA